MYFTALKLPAKEDNAKDVMQDTFMTAIEKLGDLKDGSKFPKWVNTIAVNKCKAYFRRAAEDSLDEMSLEEIASVMEYPVKTVSSRLVTAREKIREAVLIYEKSQGDRLHAVVPVPILTVILRKEAETLTIPQIPMELFGNALMNAAANASASTLTTTASVAGGSKMVGLLTGKVVAAADSSVKDSSKDSSSGKTSTTSDKKYIEWDVDDLSTFISNSIIGKTIAEAKQ